MIHGRRLQSARRAATAVEVTVALLVLLVLIFAVVEFARFMMARQLMANAAREAARLAVTSDSSVSTSQIQAAATNVLVGQPVQNVSVQVYQADPATGTNLGSWTDAGIRDSILVQVSGTYQPILPGWHYLPNTVLLSATVIMQSEDN